MPQMRQIYDTRIGLYTGCIVQDANNYALMEAHAGVDKRPYRK